MQRIVLSLVLAVLAGSAAAQTYPARPMRIVVPWPPGQATDLAGRIVAQKIGEILGQQVVADNRPGAGGIIGTDVVAKATPDGYTMLAASSGPVTINPLLQKVPYQAERELAPVGVIGLSPYLLVSAPSFPATGARELVALLKANPGKYSFASSGTGATAHLIAEWFNSLAAVQVTHVPYKGSVPALTDVISGQIAYMIETLAATLPHVRSGRLRAYGISLEKGSTLVPDIPPLAKVAGLPGFDVGAWIGIMVPSGTPAPVIDRLSVAMNSAMKAPEVRERLGTIGMEVDYRTAAEMTAYLKTQSTRFAEIIRKGNIKVD